MISFSLILSLIIISIIIIIIIVVVVVVVVTAAIAIVVALYNRDKLLFQGSRLEKRNKLTTICYLADVDNMCDFVHLFTYDDQGLFSIT